VSDIALRHGLRHELPMPEGAGCLTRNSSVELLQSEVTAISELNGRLQGEAALTRAGWLAIGPGSHVRNGCG